MRIGVFMVARDEVSDCSIVLRRSNFSFDTLQPMTEDFDESFSQQEIQERFKKLFGREMVTIEREAFFLLPEKIEKKVDD
jgi:hypothetical protein